MFILGATVVAVSIFGFANLLERPGIPWDELSQETGIPAGDLPAAAVRVDGFEVRDAEDDLDFAVARHRIGDPVEFVFRKDGGDVVIDFRAKTATKGGRDLHLTALEFSLLRFLVACEGEVVSRETILNKVWEYEKYPTTRTVDTFICSLRSKIEDDPSHPAHLVTVPRSGDKFQRVPAPAFLI